MSRLIDDIRRLGKITAPWSIAAGREHEWLRHTMQIVKLLDDQDLPVILADNVARYYYEATGQEYWNFQDHFPNLAPPYPMCWIEHRFPRKIHSDQLGDTDVSAIAPNGRVGWLLIAAELKDVDATNVPERTRWILCAEQFIDYGVRKDQIQGTPGTITMAIDAQGRMIDVPFMMSYAATEHSEYMKLTMAWLHPSLLTISFLHCKNVTLVENTVPPKLRKRHLREHGYIPANYKTLVIEPLKAILRTEGRSGEVGLPKSLHICRGHFADYREGRGLFGKHHALVWFAAHVKGTRGKKMPPREIDVKV